MRKHGFRNLRAGLLLLMVASCAAASAATPAQDKTPGKDTASAEDASPAKGDQPESAPLPFLGGFLTETRILYPLRVDTWESRNEHRYEQAEYGASVRYKDTAHEERWLDVYFYPVGLVPPENARSEMESTLRNIASLAGTQDAYERVGLGATHAFRIPVDPNNAGSSLKAYSGELAFTGKGQEYSSAIVVLVKDMYYIKGRLSLPADSLSPQATRELLETFIAGLVRQSFLISTGRCWGAQTDGAPASIPGCAAPEQMTPNVPAEQRELRFEYPPPSDRNDGSTPRLRSSRRGLS